MEATRPAGDRRGGAGSVLRLSCPPPLAKPRGPTKKYHEDTGFYGNSPDRRDVRTSAPARSPDLGMEAMRLC